MKFSKTIEWEVIDRDELTSEEEGWLHKAELARDEADADETDYCVGATAVTKDGREYTGWNTETIIHKGTHAEVSACDKIERVSRDVGLKVVVVIGGLKNGTSKEICTPCGSCAQRLLRFIHPDDVGPEKTIEEGAPYFIAAVAGDNRKVIRGKILDLLPFAFSPPELVGKDKD